MEGMKLFKICEYLILLVFYSKKQANNSENQLTTSCFMTNGVREGSIKTSDP